MKQWLYLILTGVLLVCCAACGGKLNAPMVSDAVASSASNMTKTTSSAATSTATTTTIVPESTVTEKNTHSTPTTVLRKQYASEPYVSVEEGNSRSQVAALDWDAILQKIPSDYYEQYPGQHSKPLSATLYKKGKVISLDVQDPRLMKMMNFYNNSVYHRMHSYTQGAYDMRSYEYFDTNEFRLVLTYAPVNSSMEDSFDKQIICDNTFIGVRTTVPFGNYPLSAFGRCPLFRNTVEWLSLFGF